MDNANSGPAKPREITGRFVFFALLAFFLVVAAVNGTMMTLAVQTMPGVDVRNSYEASQRFNRDIAAARAQDARGWSANATLRLRGQDALATLELRDAAKAAVAGLEVGIRLAHPATRADDRAARMSEDGMGRYVATIPGVNRGAWDVVIEADRAGERVFTSRNRIVLND
jgi:nitrogen fixation protein FixH